MTKKQVLLHMPSLTACADYVNRRKRVWRQNYSANDNTSYAWDLGTDLPATLKLAEFGWHDGAKAIAKGLELLPARHTMPSRRYGTYGSRPNAVRFATGNPACMVQRKQQDRPKPALVIAVQIGANAGTKAECMSNYGLALAAYIERLSLMGYPIELIAVDTYIYSACRFIVSWTVKPMGAPLNYSDMAFSIGHPAAMRRLSFAMAERSECPDYGTYGSAGNAVATDFPDKSNVIILNGMLQANEHSKTPEDAMDHVSTALGAALAELDLEAAH